MRELWPWVQPLKPHTGRLLLGGVLMVATVLAGIGLLGLSGWFLTSAAVTGALLAQGLQASLNIYIPGGGIRFFALARTLARYFERVVNHDTVLRLLADLRVTLFSAMTINPVRSASTQSSRRLSRLTHDIDALDNLYLRLGAPAAVALMTSLIAAGLGLMISGTTAIALLCLFAVLLVCVTVFLARINLSNTQQRIDKMEELRIDIISTLDAHKELTAAGLMAPRGQALLRDDAGIMAPQLSADRNTAVAQGLVTAVVQVAMVIVLVNGLIALQGGQLSGPMLVLVILALLGVGEAYTALPPAFSAWGATLASARRLNRESRPDAAPDNSGATRTQAGALRLENIGFGYPGQPATVVGLSFCASDQHSVGLVGRSGVGKSTVANIAAGLLPPQSGSITFPVAPESGELGIGVNLGVSYLAQRTQLFNMTLLDNLLMGDANASEDKIWKVLEVVELAATVNRWSNGILTWIGGNDYLLSGGEARRVALARALLADTPVIILDEPFTGVDAKTAERIKQRLSDYLAQRTLIALAHDRDALPKVDQVITLGT
ncbi:thiol reductant ABC exporter subunit CydC [Marinobacter sp. 1Y8]